MLAYYFELAVRSFRRNRALTLLIVMTIALGIGAAMTTLTVFHVLSGDPLPGHSQDLYYPQLDPRGMDGYVAGADPPEQLTRYDAEALLRERRGDLQAMMSGGKIETVSDGNGMKPVYVDARYTSGDFFAMFDAPFLFGGGWSKAEDDNRGRVAVIAKSLNDKLFGGRNSVGASLRLKRTEFRVIGVLDDWQLSPKFYDLTQDRYGDLEQVFLPFSTSRELKAGVTGNVSCWGDEDDEEDPDSLYGTSAHCTWVQYWVKLHTREKAAAYRQYLANYAEQQRAAGRYGRPASIRLLGLMQWLDYKQVVPGDVRLQVWLAFGFLLVCVLNTMGLLLAKFLRRSGEIGVRRALGASRRAIFGQYLVEAAAIGVVGGVLGLLFALLGLWSVRQEPDSYSRLAHLDPAMLFATFALALAASLLAGWLPAWRACRVAPAIQIKSL